MAKKRYLAAIPLLQGLRILHSILPIDFVHSQLFFDNTVFRYHRLLVHRMSSSTKPVPWYFIDDGEVPPFVVFTQTGNSSYNFVTNHTTYTYKFEITRQIPVPYLVGPGRTQWRTCRNSDQLMQRWWNELVDVSTGDKASLDKSHDKSLVISWMVQALRNLRETLDKESQPSTDHKELPDSYKVFRKTKGDKHERDRETTMHIHCCMEKGDPPGDGESVISHEDSLFSDKWSQISDEEKSGLLSEYKKLFKGNKN